MRFSLGWLRTHVDAPEPLAAIARRLTSAGFAVEGSEAVGDDTAIEVEVPSNRPDCMNHRGLAREIAAAFERPLRPLPADIPEADPPASEAASIRIEAPDLCSRYVGRVVRGVRIVPSPGWLQARLHTIGLVPKNAVVDASNYVLWDLGQPLHAFDLARVGGAAIVVRRARPGERLVTVVDGAERTLTGEMLVIADSERPTALAGVMGGRDSAISNTTRDVLIESAWFDPLSVRRTARALGLHTDASHRFERGADPGALVPAARVLARLIVETAGGTCLRGEVDARGTERPRAAVRLRHARIETVLGMPVPPADVERVLSGFGHAATRETAQGGAAWSVAPPGFRPDVTIEEDLIEEVGRAIGYDAIPATLPSPVIAPPVSLRDWIETAARDRMTSLGWFETIGYAMVGRAEDEAFAPAGTPAAIAIANPLSDRWEVMRRSLLPGLVRAASHNARHGQGDFSLFEVGTVFTAREHRDQDRLPREERVLGLIAHGRISGLHWALPARAADVWDLTGAIAAVAALRAGKTVSFSPGGGQAFVPGTVFQGRIGHEVVAFGGVLDPVISGKFDLPDGCVAAELRLAPLCQPGEEPARFRPLPRFPEVERDLSLTVPSSVAWTRLESAVHEALRGAPARFALVDRYEGPPLPAGTVSLTIRVTISPEDRTWTQEEIDRLVEGLAAALASKTGAARRG